MTLEWTAHEAIRLKAGIDAKLIDVVRYNRALAGLNEKRRHCHPFRPPDVPRKESRFRHLREGRRVAGQARTPGGKLTSAGKFALTRTARLGFPQSSVQGGASAVS